jgi:hypothetical protein
MKGNKDREVNEAYKSILISWMWSKPGYNTSDL